jgi:hypothetical protein
MVRTRPVAEIGGLRERLVEACQRLANRRECGWPLLESAQ